MSDISKIIYYCWFGGEKPQKVIDCINNWKEKLPQYQIVEINEYNKELFDVEKECQNNLWFKTVWENKMWAYAADYARLKVLYERGCVYFDTDITVEKDITELLEKNKLILGWEDKQSVNIAVGVIVTAAGNPQIKEMLDFYNDEIWHSKLYTIPQVVTHVLKKHYDLNPSTEITENDYILLFPPEYFYPTSFLEPDKPLEECVTENTYTIHWWNGSWCKDNINYFLKYKHKKNIRKLIDKCFNKKIILDNKFLKVEKFFEEISIKLDFYYLFRFQHKMECTKKYLTVFVFGFQIKLWKVN